MINKLQYIIFITDPISYVRANYMLLYVINDGTRFIVVGNLWFLTVKKLPNARRWTTMEKKNVFLIKSRPSVRMHEIKIQMCVFALRFLRLNIRTNRYDLDTIRQVLWAGCNLQACNCVNLRTLCQYV